jgi:hypothetical protein
LEYLLEAAMAMDLFQEVEFQGTMVESVLEEQYQRIQEQRHQHENDQEADNSEDNTAIEMPLLFALDAFGFRIKFARRLHNLI